MGWTVAFMVMRCVDDYLKGRRLPLDAVAALSLETAAQIDDVVNL